ncbi:MAG: DUF1653 domain-containing protein [Candidatus Paceibacterota bacterium]|jgi:hypothetical protein
MTEVKKGLYKHFKGGKYFVKDIAKHSESLEEFVVYEHLEEPNKGSIWVRPLAMFLENVDKPDYKGPRFVYIGDDK